MKGHTHVYIYIFIFQDRLALNPCHSACFCANTRACHCFVLLVCFNLFYLTESAHFLFSCKTSDHPRLTLFRAMFQLVLFDGKCAFSARIFSCKTSDHPRLTLFRAMFQFVFLTKSARNF